MLTLRSKVLVTVATIASLYVASEWIDVVRVPWAGPLPAEWASVLIVVGVLVSSAAASVIIDRRRNG